LVVYVYKVVVSLLAVRTSANEIHYVATIDKVKRNNIFGNR
jgi:hypothetical protein